MHQVLNERMRLVLCQDAHSAHAGVETVRQREVDDAELAAEVEPGLGAPGRQFVQPAPLAAGQNKRERLTSQAADVASFDGNVAI